MIPEIAVLPSISITAYPASGTGSPSMSIPFLRMNFHRLPIREGQHGGWDFSCPKYRDLTSCNFEPKADTPICRDLTVVGTTTRTNITIAGIQISVRSLVAGLAGRGAGSKGQRHIGFQLETKSTSLLESKRLIPHCLEGEHSTMVEPGPPTCLAQAWSCPAFCNTSAGTSHCWLRLLKQT